MLIKKNTISAENYLSLIFFLDIQEHKVETQKNAVRKLP